MNEEVGVEVGVGVGVGVERRVYHERTKPRR